MSGRLARTVREGDRLASLCVLRDRLAVDIDECESKRDLAALALRLQSVMAEIAELAPGAKEADPIDEIATRRAARRSGSA